ncbi:penicillin-binding protein [Bacillus sp. EB600]|uniref:penicillin-binding protein n=1 Tax=Bacillus sp. EB600 TaxID=2806345 RepID=UPI00210EEAFF|nr:penicillin-binding protein [Bacillus sp. EB600]MCQ6279759.1 penicillin-binding protein [Bacillus sp. EB600]
MIKKQKNMNVGAAILFLIFSLLFFILIIRYFSIQISGEVGGEPLAAKAQQKYSRVGTLEAQRGTIFDRTGEIVAEDSSAYTLIAILDKKMTTNPKKPMHVVDPEKTALELSKYIHLSESKINSILTKKGKFQVEFGKEGRDIDYVTKQKIEDLHLPGITFSRSSKRFYPNGIFASHLIGYTDHVKQKDESSKVVGKMGIEQELNTDLTGMDGKIDYQSDIWGYILPNNKPKVTPAKNGNDVYLTLDKKIQTFVEDAMNTVDKEYKPKMMVAIVADPKTGNVLAMEQRPTFDPETKEGINKSWQNAAVESPFEPGSTMKIFTLAAAVQENLFNPNESYQSGSYQVTPKSPQIHDWNGSGWGAISYLEGVQRSSNVAFAKIANEKLGFDKFRMYLTKFGLDKPTGIEVPNEAAGKIPFQYPIQKATTAFGQGVAITPIEQIQGATAIANDGKMMKPHVIAKVVDHDTGKTIKNTKPEVVGTPISAQTAKQVRDILETVVTAPKGTGSRYKIDGYDVAGKTGTAQIPGPGGRYLTGPSNYIFSFIGMAPKDDPKLLVYVAVQQPTIDDYTKGSIPVSMIFDPVMKNSLQYLNIQPSKAAKSTSNKLPDLTGQSVEASVQELTNKGFETVVVGKGTTVEKQLPQEGTTILEGEKVIIRTDGDPVAPDMTGWSLRDVMKAAKITDLQLDTSGSGYAVNQTIAPGTTLHEGDKLKVTFELPGQQQKNDSTNNEDNEKSF